MLKEKGIEIPNLEAPVKEKVNSERSIKFFNELYELLNIPEKYRDIDLFTGDD